MSQPIPSAQSQHPGTYTVEQTVSLSAASTNAQPSDLTTAVDTISRILGENDIVYALMGGFSMMLRGSSRRTFDIDIAVGCNMQQLIQVLSAQQGILRPSGPVSGVMRIFIKTCNDLNPEQYVMADLILQGTLGSPSNLQSSIESITTQTPLGERTYPILNTLSILSSKLNAFHQRSAAKDYMDIIFLIQNFGEKVHAVRGELDTEQKMTFINSYAGKNAGDGGLNRVRKMKFMLGVV